MKKYFRLILFIGFILLFINPIKASHLLGGEITWECLKSGQNTGKLIFRAKIYSACYQGAAAQGQSISLENPLYKNNGGSSSITCFRISNQDLSPKCYSVSRQIMCGVHIANGGDNAVQEYVYESQPVQINGIPSIVGSVFSYTECCRPAMLNVYGSGYHLRSVMYPYIESSGPKSLGSIECGPTCYDSSPIFAEKPWALVCANQNITLNNLSIDNDGDSIHYEWTAPMNYNSLPVTYKVGYSVNLPLPNKVQDTLNADPILDTNSGSISFYTNSTTGNGYYCVSVKSSIYKSGQKVAETFRDLVVVIMDCNNQVSSPQVYNVQPPKIEIKEATSSVYLSSFNKTYAVGSTILLDLKLTDLDSLPTNPVSKQSVDLSIVGMAMSDTPFTTQNCHSPPCALLDTINPAWDGHYFIDTTTLTARFIWNTSCLNLDGFTKNNSGIYSRKFYFLVRAKDNWCPAPLMSNMLFSITLEDTLASKWPLDSIDASSGGAFVRWKKYQGSGFSSYELSSKIKYSDPWNFLARKTNVSTISHYDANARTDTTSVNYKVEINSGLGCDVSYDYRTIHLNVSQNKYPDYFPRLHWNSPYVNGKIVCGTYYVHRKVAAGKWIVIDTLGYYIDSFIDLNPAINSTLRYKIVGRDDDGLSSVSNAGLAFIDTSKIPIPGFAELNTSGIKIYPNPVRDFLFVEITQSEGPMRMDIVNISGSLIEQITLKNSNNKIPISSLNKGVYILKFSDSSGQQFFRKIVKSN